MIQVPKTASHIIKVSALCIAILLVACGAAGEELPVTSPGKKSGDVFKNLKVLNDTPSDTLLPSMQFITSSLGVHCEYCHVEGAFERDDKKAKQTARRMMQMVQEINRTSFQGKQEVTCNSCHRGSPKPLAIPAIARAQPAPDQAASALSPDSNLAIPGDVIAKYVKARGGADAIATLASLEEQGIFHSDSREYPIELYASRSARSAMVIHFPGADRTTTLDGTSGWVAVPGRPVRAMTSWEADAARIEADLQFSNNLEQVFAEIKVMGVSKVGPEETVVLSGLRPGLPPVEMYFGANSGLLLRVVHYSSTALGLNPTQTDYSDYRDVNGVKVPFRWSSATSTGSFTVQIESARANQPVPEQVLSMPTGTKN